MKHALIGAVLAAMTLPAMTLPALAVPLVETPELEALRTQIENGKAADAAETLSGQLAVEPRNADILNLLGYAHRKMGNKKTSRNYYARALAIDPRHKGALEYMGELELETGNVKAARVLLARLQAICPKGCSELDDLIEAFQSRGIATKAGGS